VKTHLRGKTMIKQKRSKVKQSVLPFVLERTYETFSPRAGLILFGEFLYEFIKQCKRQMPKGKRIGYIRADAASYKEG